MSCIIMQSTVLLTQNVNIDDSLVSDVDISAIDWHEEQNADPDIRRVKTLFQIGHKPAKRKHLIRMSQYMDYWQKSHKLNI
jgi:hypothetical protein